MTSSPISDYLKQGYPSLFFPTVSLLFATKWLVKLDNSSDETLSKVAKLGKLIGNSNVEFFGSVATVGGEFSSYVTRLRTYWREGSFFVSDEEGLKALSELFLVVGSALAISRYMSNLGFKHLSHSESLFPVEVACQMGGRIFLCGSLYLGKKEKWQQCILLIEVVAFGIWGLSKVRFSDNPLIQKLSEGQLTLLPLIAKLLKAYQVNGGIEKMFSDFSNEDDLLVSVGFLLGLFEHITEIKLPYLLRGLKRVSEVNSYFFCSSIYSIWKKCATIYQEKTISHIYNGTKPNGQKASNKEIAWMSLDLAASCFGIIASWTKAQKTFVKANGFKVGPLLDTIAAASALITSCFTMTQSVRKMGAVCEENKEKERLIIKGHQWEIISKIFHILSKLADLLEICVDVPEMISHEFLKELTGLAKGGDLSQLFANISTMANYIYKYVEVTVPLGRLK